MTARAAVSGLRAHHKCMVDGWPWRIDYSRTLAVLMASSGKATSISFLAVGILDPQLLVFKAEII